MKKRFDFLGWGERKTQNGVSVWHIPGPELSVSNQSASLVEERVSGRSIMVTLSVLL